MRYPITLAFLLSLAACSFERDPQPDEAAPVEADRSADPTTRNLADSMASDDGGQGGEDTALDIADPDDRPIMQAQVVLDRLGFGPGVIDGKLGASTENALRGFQESRNLARTGEMDTATSAALTEWKKLPATRVVRIPQEWAEVGFETVPEDPADQADMQRLGYESLDEKLAERFHTTAEVLAMLNPGGRPAGAQGTTESASASPSPKKTAGSEPQAQFRAGQLVRVPNIGADRILPDVVTDEKWLDTLKSLGVGTEQPSLSKIVVSRDAGTLKGFDDQGKLVALFTVTTGSRNDPLPLGDWGVNGIGYNPAFTYNPELFWDVPDTDAKQQLPPGPNGPVGVIWIDLTKEHYGIHGTPEPQSIGRSQSHGCVRLTNWDAARLGQMVSNKTKVVFEA
jgi:lipoprotein-anchoring transpeptidase ErfK/SrfK